MKYFVYDYKKASMRNYTFSLKSIRDFLMFQVDLSYLVVGPIPRELFQITHTEFLDYYLKPVMQRSRSYIKDSMDSTEKIKDK